MPKNKDFVELLCCDCGTAFHLRYGWIKRFPTNHKFRCKPCRISHHKLWHKNMPEEQKQQISKQMSASAKKRWASMTEQEYQTICAKMHMGCREYWDNISLEEYQNRCQANQNNWDTMTDEQRKQHSQNITRSQLQRWANVTPEEYQKICEMLVSNVKNYWKNISPEERALRIQKLREGCNRFWENMTSEEFQEWNLKRIIGFNEYLNDLGIRPNRNEESFIEELDKLVFRGHILGYSRRFYNKIKHNEFESKFPSNIITGNKFVSPYHEWDFIIHGHTSSILVDIDGSIHDREKTNYTVTYGNGNKFKLCDYITYKDSQRPYQCDSYEAYIVLAYDDNLCDSTKVMHLQSGTIYTFRQFKLMLGNIDTQLSRSFNPDSSRKKIVKGSTTIDQLPVKEKDLASGQ